MKQVKKSKVKTYEWLLASLLALPNVSHATTIEGIVNNCVNYLQGSLARSLGLLAIIGLGYFCVCKQRVPKEQFVMVLLGLGIIFGGSSIYSSLVG